MKLLPLLLLMAGCVHSDRNIVADKSSSVIVSGPGAVIKKAKCPCDGSPQCSCDYETGYYRFYDGCNWTSCNATGGCTTTLVYCGGRDWRTQ